MTNIIAAVPAWLVPGAVGFICGAVVMAIFHKKIFKWGD